MKRFAFVTAAAVVFTGCAANLDNFDDFAGGNTGGSSGVTVETVFQTNCGNSVCHDADQPAAGLDLVSPNVEARTIDVSSTDGNCASEILVQIGDSDNSYLLRKVLNSPGICGGQMPIGTILDAADTEVIRLWILELGGVSPGIDEGLNDGV